MSIKKYYIEHTPTGGDISVEIDYSYTRTIDDKIYDIMDNMKEMVNFWSGSAERLMQNDDDVLITFLKQLCQKCVALMSDNNLSLYGLIREFENLEGWSQMDGSCGIKLTGCNHPDFEIQDDYEVQCF